MEYPADNALSTTRAKLEDSPIKSMSEYYNSISRGIFQNSAPLPAWDQVPRSSAQNLIESLISRDQQRAKNQAEEEVYQDKKITLDKQWEEIKTLEETLKNAFFETEEKINELKNCGTESASEKNEDLIRETEKLDSQAIFFIEETQKIYEAINNMQADIHANSTYVEFAKIVAHEHPGLYNDGAKSVLQHFERLKNAHKEITKNQEGLLFKMKRLRKDTQQLASKSLAELDQLEAQIHEINSQLSAHEAENEGQAKIALEQRELERALTGEAKRMRESLKCMYEQMWKRYNGIASMPLAKKCQEQAEYIQLAMTALENLIQHLKVADPKPNESVNPEASVRTKRN
ncbi:Hypothetical predicted protein [Cloeon dipterum]|uniref:Uncharacterized protein n=1 Tax=Cloeon dipterum TaxID=197152 RepID=A0A8S1DXT0_9INSE|nr:Hypothetical predicted protein [Cloeon dipterum]